MSLDQILTHLSGGKPCSIRFYLRMTLRPSSESTGLTAKHDVCLQAADSAQRESSTLAHQPEAIDEWVRALRQRFQGNPIAIGLELSKGPIVGASKVRLRGAVSDQPIDAGQVPRSLHAQPGQRRPQRRRAAAGAAAQTP